MPIQTDSLNKKLYDLLKTQGLKPVAKDTENETTPVPDEAEVIQFQIDNGKSPEILWATVDSSRNLTLYYDDDVMSSSEDSARWDALRNHLKSWAMRKQLSFELKNKDHLASDMAQRDYMNKKEKISEGYYPMGKTASYSDAVPTVKIVLQHNRSIQEGEQRYRNIAKIFLENQEGERFLAPTTKPGIARVYARHIAEGGQPHDDRWNHISSLCEEYQKMAGFVRAVRTGQFNESAQQLVNEGINHYQKLRESLSKMANHRGYNAYFESWTPPLMEDDTDTSSINELFVQETLDPRIESVMPILSKLHKSVSEMKEVSELAEWADSLLETPGAETLAHNDKTEEKRLQALDLEEGDGGQEALNPIGVPEGRLDGGADVDSPVAGAILRRILMQRTDLLAKYGPEKVSQAIGDVADFVGDVDEIGSSDVSGWVKQVEGELGNGSVDEGILDTVKKVGGKVLDKLGHGSDEDLLRDLKKKAGVRNPENAKPSMAHSDVEKRVDEEDVAEDLDANQKRVGQLGPTEKVKNNNIGKLVGANENFINTVDQAVVSEMDKSEDKKGPEGKAKPITPKKMADDAKKVLDKQKVKEGQDDLNAILRLLGK